MYFFNSLLEGQGFFYGYTYLFSWSLNIKLDILSHSRTRSFSYDIGT